MRRREILEKFGKFGVSNSIINTFLEREENRKYVQHKRSARIPPKTILNIIYSSWNNLSKSQISALFGISINTVNHIFKKYLNFLFIQEIMAIEAHRKKLTQAEASMAIGMSPVSIGKIWKKHNLYPHHGKNPSSPLLINHSEEELNELLALRRNILTVKKNKTQP